MHIVTRNVLLVAFGLVAATGIGLKLADKPQPISAQVPSTTPTPPPEACGAPCDTDNDCNSQNFCHFTINWESWQVQPVYNLEIERKNITSYDSEVLSDGNTVHYFVHDGNVKTCLINLNTNTYNCANHIAHPGWDPGDPGEDVITIDGETFQNPIVSYNASIIQENGRKIVIYHLTRHRTIHTKKLDYLTGDIVQAWSENTSLKSLVADYGDNWNSWVMLGFDTEIAYEDGRSEQRLIIGRVDDNDTPSTSDDVVSESLMLVRVNILNNDGSFSWSGSNFMAAGKTTWNSLTLGLGTTPSDGAQGSVVGFDKSFDSITNKYSQTVIRTYSVGSGQYENAIFIREAVKRANQQKLCKPRVYPESCTMPGYIPAQPTLTPPPPNNSSWTTPANVQGSVQCTNKKVLLSWTMPKAEAEKAYNIHTISCKKATTSQTNCDNNSAGYTISNTGVTYNATTQRAQLVFDYSKLLMTTETLTQGSTYLMKFRVASKTTSSESSAYSDFIDLKLSGPAGDFDNNCTVTISDYNDIKFQLLNPDDRDFNILNNAGLSLINQVVRNFGQSN